MLIVDVVVGACFEMERKSDDDVRCQPVSEPEGRRDLRSDPFDQKGLSVCTLLMPGGLCCLRHFFLVDILRYHPHIKIHGPN